MSSRTLLLVAATLLAVANVRNAPAAEETADAYIAARYADAPEPGAKARYSPRIEKLWAACTKKEKKTGDPCMDFNIWVNAQDWEIKNLKIDLVKGEADKAEVTAIFDNFDSHQKITYSLIKDDKGWMVDERSTGCGTLSGVLQGKPFTCD